MKSSARYYAVRALVKFDTRCTHHFTRNNIKLSVQSIHPVCTFKPVGLYSRSKLRASTCISRDADTVLSTCQRCRSLLSRTSGHPLHHVKFTFNFAVEGASIAGSRIEGSSIEELSLESRTHFPVDLLYVHNSSSPLRSVRTTR